MSQNAHVGIDFGTSGCRLCAISDTPASNILFEAREPFPAPVSSQTGYQQQDPEIWWQAFVLLLGKLAGYARQQNLHILSLSIDGTSGTIVACDKIGKPLYDGLMYHDQRAKAQAARIKLAVGSEHMVASASSALARLLWLQDTIQQPITYALHQADWVANHACDIWGISDEHNALKLGYDPVTEEYPAWVSTLLDNEHCLPTVNKSGDFLATLSAELSDITGLNAGIKVYSGTTDSTASCLASNRLTLGTGITVLGSTLVVKLVSPVPVFSSEYGIYSHRIGNNWLVGGASNSGGAVLLNFFSAQELEQLTPCLNPDTPLNLNYYPLLQPGERFPLNNPKQQAVLKPRLNSEVKFLQAMLEGIANIEKIAYLLLQQLSSISLRKVYTMGGGAANQKWQKIRQNALSIPVDKAKNTEASYGSAILSQRAYQNDRRVKNAP